jgi:hypothetical protein
MERRVGGFSKSSDTDLHGLDSGSSRTDRWAGERHSPEQAINVPRTWCSNAERLSVRIAFHVIRVDPCRCRSETSDQRPSTLKHDPASIAALYPSRDAFLREVDAASAKLVAQRFMLPGDRTAARARMADTWDWVQAH